MNNKKMKWIEYFSENGDLWQLFVEDDYQETQADTLAHNGNEAVTRREMPAIDKVQVTIIPAARIVDKVKGQVAGEKLFHLKLSLINGDDWFAISQQAFSKEEITICFSFCRIEQIPSRKGMEIQEIRQSQYNKT